MWGDIGHRYLRSPCLPEILNLECGTSGFGWLEGCGVRGWRIGPRRPKLFSPTGSSGSSLPRSVETGRPLDVNTQSPCLDRPVAPTRGRYLRGSRSQSPRALRAGRVSGLLSHRPPCSRAESWSQSTESKDSLTLNPEPEKVPESRTLLSFSSTEAYFTYYPPEGPKNIRQMGMRRLREVQAPLQGYRVGWG